MELLSLLLALGYDLQLHAAAAAAALAAPHRFLKTQKEALPEACKMHQCWARPG